MTPNPALTRVLAPNHSIEIGASSWDADETSIRSRYEGQTGRFSPRGSSEIPLPDLQLIMTAAGENDLIPVADCSAIIALWRLQFDVALSQPDRNLSPSCHDKIGFACPQRRSFWRRIREGIDESLLG